MIETELLDVDELTAVHEDLWCVLSSGSDLRKYFTERMSFIKVNEWSQVQHESHSKYLLPLNFVDQTLLILTELTLNFKTFLGYDSSTWAYFDEFSAIW